MVNVLQEISFKYSDVKYHSFKRSLQNMIGLMFRPYLEQLESKNVAL
jgi:hypothetical protein